MKTFLFTDVYLNLEHHLLTESRNLTKKFIVDEYHKENCLDEKHAAGMNLIPGHPIWSSKQPANKNFPGKVTKN